MESVMLECDNFYCYNNMKYPMFKKYNYYIVIQEKFLVIITCKYVDMQLC